MRVINQSRQYNLRPSEIINISDEYTSFCFDEACLYIIQMIEETDNDGKYINKAKWSEDAVTSKVTTNNNSSLIDAIGGLSKI